MSFAGSSTIFSVLQVTKSLTLTPTLANVCSTNGSLLYMYNIYSVNEKVNLPINQTIATITVPKTKLAHGLHFLSLTVVGENIRVVTGQIFNVSASPIEVKIVGGSARSIRYKDNFVLDAATQTIDPEAVISGSTSHLGFSWFCKTFDDSGKEKTCFSNKSNFTSKSSTPTINSTNLEVGTTYLFCVNVTGEHNSGSACQGITISAPQSPQVTIK